MELDSLTLFGLSGTESRIYLEILALGAPSASDVRRMIHISKPTLYAALKRLREAALIEEVGQRPKRYVVSNPKRLKELYDDLEKEKDKKRKDTLEEIERLAMKKSEHYCVLSPKEFMLGGYYFSDAKERIKELMDNAQIEIHIDGLPLEYMEHFIGNLKKASRRCIKVMLGIPEENIIPKKRKQLTDFDTYFKPPLYPCFDFDGKKIRSALLFVDRKTFGTIYYSSDFMMFSYMNSPGCIDCMKTNLMKGYDTRFPQKRIMPREAELVLIALKDGVMSKRELSRSTGLSGAKVNRGISYLFSKDLIALEKKGREEIVSLKEK